MSLYYDVRNGEIYIRGMYLCYVTYVFEAAYVMILIVCLFPEQFMTDIDVFYNY